MKKTFVRITALILVTLIIIAGGVNVYADGVSPWYYHTNEAYFGLVVGTGYALFSCSFEADSSVFDHAEWEMNLQRKGLIFWSDVDVTISEFWLYNASTDKNLRQQIPDQTGKYRAQYTLRIVGNNGLTDTITETVEYTYN